MREPTARTRRRKNHDLARSEADSTRMLPIRNTFNSVEAQFAVDQRGELGSDVSDGVLPPSTQLTPDVRRDR